jgi:Flp pilus assembly protein CpaB
VSRRSRAIGFASAAAICAGLAAGAAGGVGGDPVEQFGELREVVVATRPLPARRPLGRKAVAGSLELRRVPERFVSPDALSSPAEALGRRPAATIPPGAYLLASQLRTPGGASDGLRQPHLGAGRRPVEITVEGSGAIADVPAAGRRRVDVIVTTQASAGVGLGRTFVAAEGVALLALRPVTDPAAGDVVSGASGDASIATLALTRAEALRLIHAQSFARDVRLIGH